MIVCSRNTVRDSSHISFFCGGDPFCEVVRRPVNTQRELTGLFKWPAGLSLRLRDQRISPFAWATCGSLLFAWVTSGSLALAWATSRSLPSVQNYRPYIVFPVPHWYMNILIVHVFFCFWLVIETYILPSSFPIIGWSYLRTEISVTQSIGNKSYSRNHVLYFSFLWNHFVDVILRSHWIF